MAAMKQALPNRKITRKAQKDDHYEYECNGTEPGRTGTANGGFDWVMGVVDGVLGAVTGGVIGGLGGCIVGGPVGGVVGLVGGAVSGGPACAYMCGTKGWKS